MDAPREDLTRASKVGLQTRGEGDDALPTLYGHFSMFNQWYEVHSYFEGDFIERIAPGAFSKTMKENRANMRVLYDHGYDPQLGNKPLGPIDELHEDKQGAYYEVPLIDTDYNRSFVIPALRADLLGASFRFNVLREEWNEEPDASDHNPKGLPERTIKETRVHEFGPVTFPASPSATAKARSLTDHYRNLRTSPDDTPPHRAPAVGDAAPPSDAPPAVAPAGLTYAEREYALRAVLL